MADIISPGKPPTFYPSTQIAYVIDDWESSPFVGASIHGVFGILLGLFSGLSVILIYQGWLRRRLQRISWGFYAIPCASILGLVLFCFIQLVGSRNMMMDHFYYDEHCLAPVGQEGKGDDAHWQPCSYGPARADEISLVEPLLALQLLLPLMSDGMIVRRTQILVGHRAVSILLGLSWLVTFGMAIGVIVLHAQLLTAAQPTTHWSLTDQQIAFAFALSSMICNLFATGCIGIKLWLYRRELTVTLGIRNAKFTHPQKVLAFLIESGSVFCLVQFVYIIILTLGGLTIFRHGLELDLELHLRPPNTSSRVAAYVFQQLFTIVSGLYPAIVLLIINLQILYSDSTETFSLMDVLGNVPSQPVPQSDSQQNSSNLYGVREAIESRRSEEVWNSR